MWRRLSCLLLVMAVVAGLATPAGSEDPSVSLYRVGDVTTREARTAVASTGAGIDEVGRDYVLVRATPAERDAIAGKGYPVEPAVEAQDFPPSDSDYHNYAEMQSELQSVAAAYPSTVHRFDIGRSSQNRVLEAVRISDDANDNTSEPGVLFVASHHAREHLTVEVALDLVRLFAESTDPTIRSLVASRQIYVIPNLNPDGSEYDISGGTYQSWRKNRQPNSGTSAIGTDLNRNYSYRWGCCGGSSGSPGSETYRGPSAFSAPETARLRDFVNNHANIGTAISYHSYGDLILYPYGYTYKDLPPDMSQIDRDAFVAMAREMARTSGYKPQQASDLYITDGDFNDWMYGAKHIYPFTIELGGGDFYPGDGRIATEQAKNRDAAVYVAQLADCPTRVVGGTCGATPPPSAGITNGGFESGLTGWTPKGAVAVSSPVRTGAGAARLGATNGVSHRLDQTVSVPSSPSLSLHVQVQDSDTSTKDRFRVRVIDSAGNKTTVATFTAAGPHGSWQLVQPDLSRFAGQSVTLRLQVDTNSSVPSSFFVDDVAI